MNTLKVGAVATGHYARSSFGNYLEHFSPGKSEYVTIHFFVYLFADGWLCRHHSHIFNLVISNSERVYTFIKLGVEAVIFFLTLHSSFSLLYRRKLDTAL